MARATSPEIFVVTKANNVEESPTIKSYTKFFGKGNFTVFGEGLTTNAIDVITTAPK